MTFSIEKSIFQFAVVAILFCLHFKVATLVATYKLPSPYARLAILKGYLYTFTMLFAFKDLSKI